MGVKEGVSRQLGRVGRKTSALLEEAKLRGSVASLESEVKRLYEDAGMSMFFMWKRGEVDTGRLAKHFEAIQRRLEQIEEKKEQIRQVRGDAAGKNGREAHGPSAAERLALPEHVLTETSAPDGARAGDGTGTERTDASEQRPGMERTDASEQRPGTERTDASEQQAGTERTDASEAEDPGKTENVVIEEEDSDGDPERVIETPQAPRTGVLCTCCGAECPADANFCRKCGAKLR